jgi:hypothetical protein
MSKHTPGPWRWDGDPTNIDIFYRDQHAPWLVSANDDIVLGGDMFATEQADAALIAAAPELLEALKAYVSLCGNTAHTVDREGLFAAWEAAEAAIAKAEAAQ